MASAPLPLAPSLWAAIARYLLRGDAQALPFPLRPVRPIPLRGVQRLYLSGIIASYRMTDAGLV
jgi:hypothetical protein